MYHTPILTIYVTTDWNLCPSVNTGEKFPNFCLRVFFQVPEMTKFGVILCGVLVLRLHAPQQRPFNGL